LGLLGSSYLTSREACSSTAAPLSPIPQNLIRIERAVERSIAVPPAYDEAQVTLSLAAKRPLTRGPRSDV
jgi:hypothetical protein